MKVLVVTNMWPNDASAAFGVFVKEQVDALTAIGVEIDVLFLDGRSSKLEYLRAFPRLWKRLRANRYDLIHAHHVLAGVVTRAQWGLPIVLTHHGIEVLQGWQARASWILSRVVDQVVVASEEMHRKLGLAEAHVIPSGVDVELFRPLDSGECRRRLGLPLDRCLVLFVGERRPEKRFDVAERAVALLNSRARAHEPPVHLVQVNGARPREEVPQFMNACDVLVLTSEVEGSPMVVKEAMACNLPIVSVRVGDVSERIERDEHSFLCERTADDVADKLSRALAKPTRSAARPSMLSLGHTAIAERVRAVYERAVTHG